MKNDDGSITWAAGIEGTTAAGDDIDVSFTDILEDLDGGVMGILAARKGKWALLADVIYLRIHQEDDTTANLDGLPVKLDVDVQLEGFVSTFGAAYRVFDDELWRQRSSYYRLERGSNESRRTTCPSKSTPST